MMVTLETFETVLTARARAMGAEIRHAVGVEDFDQSNEHVTPRRWRDVSGTLARRLRWCSQ